MLGRYVSDVERGDEFTPFEYVVSEEMLPGVDGDHPFFREKHLLSGRNNGLLCSLDWRFLNFAAYSVAVSHAITI